MQTDSFNNSRNVLANGTPMVLRVNEYFEADNAVYTGTVNATVVTDVYSVDGTRVLIKAGTPAVIECYVEPNGSWGKAGKISLSYAITTAVDSKKIPLGINFCKYGSNKIVAVVLLSVIFFPLGLLSGFMHGSMPIIESDTTFYAYIMQTVTIE